jgi:aspartate/methionine/tyrosine aminotransferase
LLTGPALDALGDPTGPQRLREAIAQRYQVAASQVVLCIGASQANALVGLAYLRPSDEVVVETPTYEALFGLAEWIGAKVVRVARRKEFGWALDLEALEAAVTDRTRLVMLTTPNNPTGRPFGQSELARLHALSVKTGVPILVDEIYRDDLPDPPPVAASGPGTLLTTSSLTKVYGLSSLRMGWVLAPEAIARRLDELTDWLHVNPPLPSVALALAAWPRLEAWRAEDRRAIARARSELEAWRERTGLLPGPIFEGMPFYLADVAGDDRRFCEQLAAPGTVRVGFGRAPPDELARALTIIERVAANG